MANTRPANPHKTSRQVRKPCGWRWRAAAPEERLHGRLSLFRGRHSELALSGRPAGRRGVPEAIFDKLELSPQSPQGMNLVGALTVDGKPQPASALNCFLTREAVRINSSGVVGETWQTTLGVPLVVLGAAIEKAEDPVFAGIAIEYDLLATWAGAAPFADSRLVFDEQRRPQKLIPLGSTTQGRFHLSSPRARGSVVTRLQQSGNYQRLSLQATTEVLLEFDVPLSAVAALDPVDNLQGLLTLLANSPAQITSVKGKLVGDESVCQLHFNWPLPWADEPVEFPELLVTLGSRRLPELDTVAERWTTLRSSAGAPISILVEHVFRTARNEVRYQDSEFLNVTRALEGLDRHFRSRGRTSDAELPTSPPGSAGVENATRRCRKRPRVTFFDRVQSTVEAAGSVGQGLVPDKVSFAARVRDARNHYAHVDLKLPPVDGKQAARLSAALRVLLLARNLHYLGYQHEEILLAFRRSTVYTYARSGFAPDW